MTPLLGAGLWSNGRDVLRLSAPLALFNLGQTLLGTVDSMFMGRVGAAELGAVALGNMLLFAVLVLGMGAVFGIEPLVAQAIGAGRHRRARSALITGLLLATGCTPLVWLAWWGLAALLPSFGIDDEVAGFTSTYLLGRAPGVPFALAYAASRAYLSAYDRTRSIVVGIVLANVLNVPADLFLIFDETSMQAFDLGRPFASLGGAGLGVMGAAVASSFAAFVQLATTLAPSFQLARTYGLQPHPTQSPRSTDEDGAPGTDVPDHAQDDDDQVGPGPVLRLGIPVGLQYCAEVGIFAAVAIAMGRLGPVLLAAHQIALSLASLAFRVSFGISSATAIVVGRRVGAGDRQGTLQAGVSGLGLGTIVMLASGVVLVSFPRLLARAFTPDPVVVEEAALLIRIAAAFQLSDGLQTVAGGALRGAGEPAWAFGVNVVAYWLFAFPLALLLGFGGLSFLGPELEEGFGGPGLWWGLTLGLTLAAIGQVSRFWYRARRGYRAL